MTTDIDSETPNSHPCIDIMATTLTITIVTQPMAIVARIQFWVASSKMQYAKVMAIMIPLTAEVTKARSEAIQDQKTPAFCSAVFRPLGAVDL